MAQRAHLGTSVRSARWRWRSSTRRPRCWRVWCERRRGT